VVGFFLFHPTNKTHKHKQIQLSPAKANTRKDVTCFLGNLGGSGKVLELSNP
jgi:hypothetical protein